MGYLMLVLSPTLGNPKSIEIAVSVAKKTNSFLLVVFIVDTRITVALTGRMANVGFSWRQGE